MQKYFTSKRVLVNNSQGLTTFPVSGEDFGPQVSALVQIMRRTRLPQDIVLVSDVNYH